MNDDQKFLADWKRRRERQREIDQFASDLHRMVNKSGIPVEVALRLLGRPSEPDDAA